ncbi:MULTISPECIES: GUN4 domain-containing protein [Okeania]|uniref:GUN4-like domain-containing protein n=1 Tax=Okeania hirsuta TaxID=1458930 RepID=A0A3N6QXL4_9CYAN|nr:MULTISPECIES: GUN4 domain-containing protein [Okeania]NET80090.1 hypothetical protein [Okeania sp. SIO1F9]RQH05188.1 hypothetical protein D4Z78_30845 [Okeania hirsuta]RQH21780.1 hypothetical protein D5R40_31240 [Okeania hirsuta]
MEDKKIWIIADETASKVSGEKDPVDTGANYPDGVEDTAIPLYFVIERLRRCGADNVILFLDACRSQESSKGLGIGEEKQKGVITIASCSPNERSYEIEDERIKQGAFTYALLESLRIQGEGNCATVERLYNRLSYRVTDINSQFRKPRQTPYAIVEPATKYHLILLEKQANLRDIATLENDAYQAEVEKNIELARHLWTRVLAVSPANEKALKALRRIWQMEEPIEPQSEVIETSPQNDEIKLLSEKNVDYTKLRKFLANGEWKQADEETVRAMLKCARQQKNLFGLDDIDLDDGVLPEILITTYLKPESIENFPTTDLQTIDKLWVKYSNGKFGFSVQKKIYKNMLDGTKSYDEKIWEAFGHEVGWYREGEWSYYSDLTFYLNEARAGHLPGCLVFKKGVEGKDGWEVISILSHRKL